MQYFLAIGALLLFAVPAFTWQNSRAEEGVKTAVFGGGCFWCMEPPFEQLEGVIDVTAGYSGGEEKDPSYELVSSGLTSHIESVKVVYDPKKITYKQLLDTFWRQIDPTDDGGQFADRGEHYRTAIFYNSEEEKRIAEESKKELADAGVFERPIVTGIVALTPFYPAEEHHQDYYKKNVLHYTAYKTGSGRSGFLQNTWRDEQVGKTGKKYTRPDDKDLKKKLTALQYDVVVNNATEPAFNNKYWDNKQVGIYVDIASGEPLFSSLDKYKSGTGWPSFTRPLVDENIVEKKDRMFFTMRTEARSASGDSHLGHIFEDGPEPTRLRYCINSASLDFIAVDNLDELGYGSFLSLFKKER